MTEQPQFAIQVSNLVHRYDRLVVLDDISFDVPTGSSVALIGPDGVGKSTLFSLLAGAKRLQQGSIHVLGADIKRAEARRHVQPRLAFMPQGLGRNLYATLSVRENVDYFASLFGAAEMARIAHLLDAIGLAPFADRPAGKLSGGMKQKLGLCCALVHEPDILILDEPTTGVDPLSRRHFWQLIEEIRSSRPGMTVVVGTSYMEEAEHFDRVLLMQGGRFIEDGEPSSLIARYSAGSLEDVFTILTDSQGSGAANASTVLRVPPTNHVPIVVEGEGLTRRFGDFTAVDSVNFEVRQGEIFGFLGSNGCGKTTTMKMLTGLLPSTEGTARLFGKPVDARDIEARRKVGYMSQGFSLYGELTVQQNFDLHARLFGLTAHARSARVAELVERFGLRRFCASAANSVPLGVRQRLSLAIAILHEPAVLILDEPTSGVDPAARAMFWKEIERLSSEQQITVFISTHFMSEAERCDRVAFMHAGRIIATGTPRELCAAQGVSDLEEAFIAYMREGGATESDATSLSDKTVDSPPPAPRLFSMSRFLAVCQRETIEIIREPVRFAIALAGTLILSLAFGYGISFDVEGVSLGVLDRDRTPTSRAYIEEFASSPYFNLVLVAKSDAEVTRALRTNRVALALDIPPDFGRDLFAGRRPAVGAWIDGAMPFRAETVGGYAQAIHSRAVRGIAPVTAPRPPAYRLEPRFRYNQGFRSLDAMVPVTIGILLALIPAILTALTVVREKELGSIVNLYVTPLTRLEFLVGKQLPYIAIGFINFLVLMLLAVTLFGLQIKGSQAALIVGGLLYVAGTTAVGFVTSAATRSQTAAIFSTAILIIMPAVEYSGMMQPVASLEPIEKWIGTLFPTSHFVRASVGTFAKGLGFAELIPTLAILAAFWPALMGISLVFTRKQEK